MTKFQTQTLSAMAGKILMAALLVIFTLAVQAQTQIGSDINGEAAGDASGRSVSLSSDGKILAIGATGNDGGGSNSGHVRVYQWNGSAWTQLGADINGEAAADQSGRSVSLSSDGKFLAIGAHLNDGNGLDAGHVRVYEWDGSAWTQLGTDIDGEMAGDYFGFSVSLSSDGKTLAAGAYLNDGSFNNAGHVRVYNWDGSNWNQIGSDIDGEAANDQSGVSVSLASDGKILAIGAALNDGGGSNAGHVRVYEWNGSAWTQVGSDINGEAAADRSGTSVSLSSDGKILAIGAHLNDGNGSNAGHVRVYEWNGSAWTQVGADIDGEAAGDYFGFSVSLSADGKTFAAGAYLNDGNGSDAGHARVYNWNGSAWTQVGADIDGEAAGDQSGFSVSLSSDGTTVAAGAPGNDGSFNNAGHVRVYSLLIPEIALTGNSNPILDGSTTVSVTNYTDFGTVTTSKAITYTIENTGTGTLNVSSIVVSGANSTDFVVSGLITPTTIASSSSKSFVVTFTPSATGTRMATITVNNDDADEAAYDFAVQGTKPAVGIMRITEFMYSGASGEFIEFTNIGDAALDMTGWSFSDNIRTPGTQSLSAFGVVQPQESVILTEATEAAFRSAWNLPASVKIIGGLTNNLGRADEINLYDQTSALVDRLTYGDQTYSGTIRTQNVSGWAPLSALGITPITTDWVLSTVGDQKLSYISSGGDIGNPGLYFISPGVQILQSGGSTAVTEGGANDTYTVRLNTQPTADVTITLTPDAQISLSATSLTFTTTNWNVVQTITVNAVDDNDLEGSHSGTITHSSSSTDPDYNLLGIGSITVSITDNEVPLPAIKITEFMYTGNGAEFFELTNTGSTDVDVTGWSFDDNSRTPGSFSLSGLGTIKAGESVIITDGVAATFRSVWGLCNGIKVLGGSTQNLGRNDEINIYDASNVLIDRLTYNDQGTSPVNGPRTQNASAWVPASALGNNTFNQWTLSTVSDIENSKTSTAGDVGSPGYSKRASVSFDPCFVDPNTPIIAFDPATNNLLDGGNSMLPEVSGSLGTTDPTDPARTLGIKFTVTDPQGANTTTVTATSDNQSVVPNANLTVIGSGTADITLKIEAAAAGYANITLTASDGVLSSTYTFLYAASEAAQTNSRFHAGKSDASTAIALDADFMIVADDEDQKLRIFDRKNSGLPLNSFDFSTSIGLTVSDELDIEASTRVGNTLYWLGSHSNSKSGNDAPKRERLFSTTLSGSGASSTLSFGGYYSHLAADLGTWDASNAHGLGSNYFGLTASAAGGVPPEAPNGFSIEGFSVAPGSTTTAFLGFRAPIVPASARTKALIVPITNFSTILNSSGGTAGSATFGTPIELDLGGRGIRSLECNSEGCLILAGNAGSGGNFKLYRWTGNSADAPIELTTDLSATAITGAGGINASNSGSFETIVELPTGAMSTWSGQTVQLLLDNGDVVFYGDGIAAKDLSQTSLQKFRSQPVVLSEPPMPKILVQGNFTTIADGDNSPSLSDHTHFDTTVVNTTRSRSFKIFNTGSAVLNISSISVSGANSSEFVVSGAPSSVAVGDSASFSVAFTPTASGDRRATITINSNDADKAAYDFDVKGLATVAFTFRYTTSGWEPYDPGTNLPSGASVLVKSGATLTIPVSTTFTGNITVEAGATLINSGQINGDVMVFGTYSLRGAARGKVVGKLNIKGKMLL